MGLAGRKEVLSPYKWKVVVILAIPPIDSTLIHLNEHVYRLYKYLDSLFNFILIYELVL